MSEKPALDKNVQDVIDYAVQMTSLSNQQGKLRLKRGVSDLMHTVGFYAAEQRKSGLDRLPDIVSALKHISENLTKD